MTTEPPATPTTASVSSPSTNGTGNNGNVNVNGNGVVNGTNGVKRKTSDTVTSTSTNTSNGHTEKDDTNTSNSSSSSSTSKRARIDTSSLVPSNDNTKNSNSSNGASEKKESKSIKAASSKKKKAKTPKTKKSASNHNDSNGNGKKQAKKKSPKHTTSTDDDDDDDDNDDSSHSHTSDNNASDDDTDKKTRKKKSSSHAPSSSSSSSKDSKNERDDDVPLPMKRLNLSAFHRDLMVKAFDAVIDDQPTDLATILEDARDSSPPHEWGKPRKREIDESMFCWLTQYLGDKEYKQSGFGVSLLHIAAGLGHVECVRLLLKVGGDPTQPDEYGTAVGDDARTIIGTMTPIHEAAAGGHIDVLQVLYQQLNDDQYLRGRSATIVNNYGSTPLHVACQMGQIEAVKWLVNEQKYNVETVDDDDYTAFLWAVNAPRRHRVPLMRCLIDDYRADLNVQDNDGNTALMWAANMGCPDIVEMLVTKDKARIDTENKEGQRAEDQCGFDHVKEKKEVEDDAAQAKEDRDIANGVLKSSSPHFAATHDALKRRAARIAAITPSSPTLAPKSLSSSSSVSKAKDIIDLTSATHDSKDPQTDSILHVPKPKVKSSGKSKTTSKSIPVMEGTQWWALSNLSRSAQCRLSLFKERLWRAVDKGDEDAGERKVIQLTEELEGFRKKGIKIPPPSFQADGKRNPPLHEAVAYATERMKVFKALLRLGLDVKSYNDKGETVMHISAEHGNIEALEAIFKLVRKADPNIRARDNCTPLIHAVAIFDLDRVPFQLATIDLLVEKGADINAADVNGNTPLIWAAFAGNAPQLEALLARGAKVDLINKYGSTAMHYAIYKAWCSCDGRASMHVHWQQGTQKRQKKKELRDMFNDTDKLTREHAAANALPGGHISPQHIQCVRLLMGAGASVISPQNYQRHMPLDLACSIHYIDGIQLRHVLAENKAYCDYIQTHPRHQHANEPPFKPSLSTNSSIDIIEIDGTSSSLSSSSSKSLSSMKAKSKTKTVKRRKGGKTKGGANDNATDDNDAYEYGDSKETLLLPGATPVGKDDLTKPILAQLDDLSGSLEPVKVRVENRIDTSLPPTLVKYINKCIASPGVHIPQPTLPHGMKHCSCVGTCMDASSNCPCYTRPHFEAKHVNNLAFDPEKVRYECGPSCSCSPNCLTKNAGVGIRHRLVVYKTHYKGWGVRCLDDIQSGEFVSEYIGAIIKEDDACRRTMESAISGTNYVFTLNSEYSLEPVHYGNVSRFFNHSCNPNLDGYHVYQDHENVSFPRLCFYATRLIKAGEELTFSYGYQLADFPGTCYLCRCGAPLCRQAMT